MTRSDTCPQPVLSVQIDRFASTLSDHFLINHLKALKSLGYSQIPSGFPQAHPRLL